MIIKVDKEGLVVMEALCDIALKVGGIKNRQFVNEVMDRIISVEDVKPVDPIDN